MLLSGIHLMRSWEVVANLPILNEEFGLREVDELAERKRAGAEKMPLESTEIAAHEVVLDRLSLLLEEAHARSTLPEEPRGLAALEDFVVRTRLAALDGDSTG